MGEVWTFDGAPTSTVGAFTGLVTLLEGTTFCICETSGDMRPAGAQGLFVRDTRLISRLELSINGHVPEPLAPQSREPFACTFLSRMPPPAGLADSTLLVTRRRELNDGMREEITLRNMSSEPVPVNLRIGVAGDFADVFEVKEGRVHGDVDVDGLQVDVEDDAIKLSRQVGSHLRGASITGSRPADAELEVSASHLTWHAVVPAHGKWSTYLQVTPSLDGRDLMEFRSALSHEKGIRATGPQQRLADWRRQSPLVKASDERLDAVFAASTEDLGSLRIFDPEHADRAVIAAGAPWFMTIFGRDSLLTSWMVLPLDPSLALGTLRTLASLQGTKVDPATEEEPGKILHEMRFGMQASLWLGGGSVYYGSIDATALFVMLLGELRRWGLERRVVDELLPHADRALEWIEKFGDKDGDGFVEYARTTELGLANQGWKDSFDGITFASGEIAEPPIALAEVQGYVYAAYLAKSHFCTEREDADGASYWAQKAEKLKEDFNRAFWISDKGYFALGLDRDKRQIDSLASNMGHCLWTGIVDAGKAAAVARNLTGPEMFSGFGIRTLASSSTAYNPMSYHNGSIWPHDNAICAAGLMRYGFVREAQQVSMGILEAAEWFGGRLPELFCGFDRTEFSEPVYYPTSCSPQAWASATPFQLLRTLLRFDPSVPTGKLWCDPAFPARFLPLHIESLHVAGARVSVDVTEDGWSLDGLSEILTLVRSGRDPLTSLSLLTASGRAGQRLPRSLAELSVPGQCRRVGERGHLVHHDAQPARVRAGAGERPGEHRIERARRPCGHRRCQRGQHGALPGLGRHRPVSPHHVAGGHPLEQGAFQPLLPWYLQVSGITGQRPAAQVRLADPLRRTAEPPDQLAGQVLHGCHCLRRAIEPFWPAAQPQQPVKGLAQFLEGDRPGRAVLSLGEPRDLAALAGITELRQRDQAAVQAVL
jgi:glycogen debranching enzyme